MPNAFTQIGSLELFFILKHTKAIYLDMRNIFWIYFTRE